MKIICSYCKKSLGEKEPLSDNSITHSICEDCFEKQIAGSVVDEAITQAVSEVTEFCGCGERATHYHHEHGCCGGSMCCSYANI